MCLETLMSIMFSEGDRHIKLLHPLEVRREFLQVAPYAIALEGTHSRAEMIDLMNSNLSEGAPLWIDRCTLKLEIKNTTDRTVTITNILARKTPLEHMPQVTAIKTIPQGVAAITKLGINLDTGNSVFHKTAQGNQAEAHYDDADFFSNEVIRIDPYGVEYITLSLFCRSHAYHVDILLALGGFSREAIHEVFDASFTIIPNEMVPIEQRQFYFEERNDSSERFYTDWDDLRIGMPN